MKKEFAKGSKVVQPGAAPKEPKDVSGEVGLVQRIAEARRVLYQLRVKHALDPLKNPRRITQQKREIGRLLTALNQSK